MPVWTKEDLIAYENRRASSRPQPEPVVQHESVAKKEGKGGHAKRFQVRVVSYRNRLLDPDNLCPKYFVDCLRYAGIIPEDTPQAIKLEVTQEKVATRKEERTEITIEECL